MNTEEIVKDWLEKNGRPPDWECEDYINAAILTRLLDRAVEPLQQKIDKIEDLAARLLMAGDPISKYIAEQIKERLK